MSKNSVFHVHTYRCGHMDDDKKEWEYIEKAIELGATEIWFTDHAPFPGNPFNNRMRIEELPEYVATLQELKQRYEGKIDVKIGLEIEYLPNFENYYEELRDSGCFDMLLLGEHFSLLSEGTYSFSKTDKCNEAKELANGMIMGMKSGFFQAVAHPDQIFRRKKVWDDECEQIANEIKNCAEETGVVLEKNICNMIGKKKSLGYRSEFWKRLPTGVEIVYGLDAHSSAELVENYLCRIRELNIN